MYSAIPSSTLKRKLLLLLLLLCNRLCNGPCLGMLRSFEMILQLNRTVEFEPTQVTPEMEHTL